MVLDSIRLASMDFALRHADDPIDKLAFLAAHTPGIDSRFALDQAVGRRIAREKLPHWYAINGIVYPPHTPMEQCSSQQTAEYKTRFVIGDSLVDLTGGFGVDFSAMATVCRRATYVERDPALCEIVRHNLPLLGLPHAIVAQTDAETFLSEMTDVAGTVYLDPARRDTTGHRVHAIGQCSPDVGQLAPALLRKARRIVVKLSPMLDISHVLSELPSVSELHVLGVGGECKELLIVMDRDHTGATRVVCQMIGQPPMSFSAALPQPAVPIWDAVVASDHPQYVYIPNATIMKGGCFGSLCNHFPDLRAVAPSSHVFVSDSAEPHADFPGRKLLLLQVSSLDKRELRLNLAGIDRANVAVRNFPMTAVELSRRLEVADGGDHYLLGTTLADGRHVVLVCRQM